MFTFLTNYFWIFWKAFKGLKNGLRVRRRGSSSFLFVSNLHLPLMEREYSSSKKHSRAQTGKTRQRKNSFSNKLAVFLHFFKKFINLKEIMWVKKCPEFLRPQLKIPGRLNFYCQTCIIFSQKYFALFFHKNISHFLKLYFIYWNVNKLF